ncbi:MAG: acetolactate synthase [Rhodobacter sp.]|nr:acetolactate synthase [Rhodobacter sp.]
MLFAVLAAAGGCEKAAPSGELVPVPSGREVRLIEVVTNSPGPAGATARFRFLAPGLTEADAETVADDLQALCDSFALARIDGFVPEPQQIIISLAGAEVPFGEAAPDVVQFFESYRPEDGACQWEAF